MVTTAGGACKSRSGNWWRLWYVACRKSCPDRDASAAGRENRMGRCGTASIFAGQSRSYKCKTARECATRAKGGPLRTVGSNQDDRCRYCSGDYRVLSLDPLEASPDSGCLLFGKARCGNAPGLGGPMNVGALRNRDGRRKQAPVCWVLAAFLLFLLVAIPPAGASLVEVTVEAEDETEAKVVGLEQALVRLAGFHSPAILGLVPELLHSEDTPWLRALERRGANGFLLAFDRERLRAALEAASVPVWVGSRPALLVWVVVERGERRLLLGSGLDEGNVLEALQEFALRRDLPLLFPLGDLEDRRRVHTADVIGGATEALAEPSRRYEPDGLLLLHLVPRGDLYRASARIEYQNQRVHVEASAASPAAAAREATAGAIDALGTRLARVVTGDDTALIGFVDVGNMADLQRLRARLARLEAIREVRLSRVLPGAAILELRTGLDAFTLAEVLRSEGFSPVGRRHERGDDVGTWFRPPR